MTAEPLRRHRDPGPHQDEVPLRVALDATPLLGRRTGVGAFTSGLLGQLAHRADLAVRAYALTWRAGATSAPPCRLRWRCAAAPWPPDLEAMSVGVPVVASTAGSLPEVLRDAALLVPVGDVDSLAAALETLVDGADRRTALVSAGRQRVAGYSWDRCAGAMAALYRQAAA